VGRTLVIAALFLAGCGLLPGGISRDQAIQVAAREVEVRSPVLFNAYEGRYPVEEEQRRVWIVTFNGFLESCQVDGSPPCRQLPGRSVLYVDYVTGEVIASTTGT
jgi:hypothetical protein